MKILELKSKVKEIRKSNMDSTDLTELRRKLVKIGLDWPEKISRTKHQSKKE